MKFSDITRFRLYNQQLLGSRCRTPEELLSWMAAIQGQDYTGAKWSIGLRVPGATDASVEQSFDEKRIVRTWAMRGTLQFIAAKDVRWILELLAPGLITGNARRYRELELDERTLKKSSAVIEKAVRDGGRWERQKLLGVLEQNGISAAGQRGVYMLQRASLEGLVVQRIERRAKQFFVSLDGDYPRSGPSTREEALAELAWRYFSSRGPAILQDYLWWSGLTAKDARLGIAGVRARLEEGEIEGKTYWWTGDSVPSRVKSSNVWLLSGFDEYLLGYRDRSAAIPDKHRERLLAKNGVFEFAIVQAGRVVGTWKPRPGRNGVSVEIRPFEGEDFWTVSFSGIARRYSQFLGQGVVIKQT